MEFLIALASLTQIVPPAPTDVRGRIVLKTGVERGLLDVRVGGNGGEGAGVSVENDKVLLLKTRRSFVWDAPGGPTFHFKSLQPGRRLITAAWSLEGPPSATEDTRKFTPYVAWRWFDPAHPPKEDIVLLIEPGVRGDAEVTLAPGVVAESVSFMPCDDEGKVPDWSERRRHGHFTAPVRDGRASFKGMKPGRYVFFPTPDTLFMDAPPLLVGAEVKENALVQAKLES